MALVVAALLVAVTTGLDAVHSVTGDIPFLRREALVGLSPTAWLLAKLCVDLLLLLPATMVYACVLRDAAQLHAPLEMLLVLIAAHGVACAGIGTCIGVTLIPSPELFAAVSLLFAGGLLNGVSVLELRTLRPAHLSGLLAPFPARWTSEALLGLEAYSSPNPLSRLGLKQYLMRRALAPDLLDGRVPMADFVASRAAAVLVIGLVVRLAALALVAGCWRMAPRRATRAGGRGC
jgi:hypothetical protein